MPETAREMLHKEVLRAVSQLTGRVEEQSEQLKLMAKTLQELVRIDTEQAAMVKKVAELEEVAKEVPLLKQECESMKAMLVLAAKWVMGVVSGVLVIGLGAYFFS